jgi:hypothetical protein
MTGLPKLGNRVGALTWRRGVLLVALLLFLAYAGYKAHQVWGLVHSLQRRLDKLQAVADDSVNMRLSEVGENLQEAHSDLRALRSEIALFVPLTQFLGWVPVVGDDLRAAPALLDIALNVTEAGTIAFDGLEPLVTLLDDASVEDQFLAQALRFLSDARPDLQAAQARLAVAQERRPEIDDGVLTARTAHLVAQLDRYLPLMQTALDVGCLLPDLLGVSGQRTYLILAQNNDELRATGGFISAAGKLVLEDGEIANIVFEDSYAVDDFRHSYPDSPDPFLRYMGIDQWVFRDANWSPDFPESAKTAVELYQISRDLEVDGVLAVDQHALQAIVAALAPLDVQGWPEPVTGNNVISLIRLAWSPTEVENWSGFDPQWWRQRKSFMGDLIGAMQIKVETEFDQINWPILARAVFQILDERHLQVWLTDSTNPAADLLAEQNWDGAIGPATSDYLLVVDSNIGFNKANAMVQESLDYRVLVSADDTAQATLTVRHVHPSKVQKNCDPQPHYGVDYGDLIDRCYWDYLRVYVPSGSQLFAATAHPVAPELLLTRQRQAGAAEILDEEKGKTVFASFFVLSRGKETETRFVYELPPATFERTDAGLRYKLLVQKQAGTHAIPLRVTLALPPGGEVQSIAPPDWVQKNVTVQKPDASTVVFESVLDRDQVFEVVYQSDGL